uniref:Uncharacterized protein n=1 Tax=Oryza meridionalis TaxID=40149 RepID=A0A0E0D140_9ORYZ
MADERRRCQNELVLTVGRRRTGRLGSVDNRRGGSGDDSEGDRLGGRGSKGQGGDKQPATMEDERPAAMANKSTLFLPLVFVSKWAEPSAIMGRTTENELQPLDANERRSEVYVPLTQEDQQVAKDHSLLIETTNGGKIEENLVPEESDVL